MKVIDYIDTANGYVHHILVPDYNMPFLFWLLMVIAFGSLIFLILKKILNA